MTYPPQPGGHPQQVPPTYAQPSQVPYQQYAPYQQHPTQPWAAAPYPPPAPPPRQQKRRKWPWIVGAVVLLIMISAIANGGRGGSAPSATIAGATVTPPAAPLAATADIQETEPSAPPPAPEPPPTPIVYEGKGDDVVTLQKPEGVAVLDFECGRCSQNVIVKTDGADPLLVNTIGAYKGRHLIDASSTSRTGTLTITAKGSWKITVTPGLSALRRSDGQAISGAGDDVVLVAASTSKAAVTYRGEQNFIVEVIGQYTSDLPINEIGSYQGTVPLRGPAVVMVTSSGDWSITPS